jgi:hypothetical protein
VFAVAGSADAGGRPGTSNQLSIDAQSRFDGPNGTFTAQGAGLCESGTTTADGVSVSVDGRRLVFDVRTTFTCADGSGTWAVHIVATVEPCDAFDYGTWDVTGGTGAYRRLRATGQLVGTYMLGSSTPSDSCNADGIVDHYRGTARSAADR